MFKNLSIEEKLIVVYLISVVIISTLLYYNDTMLAWYDKLVLSLISL